MGEKGATLERSLGFWQIWAIGVGSVVGDGIFLYLGEGISLAGPSSLVAFFIAGVMQMFVMLAMGEIAVGMPAAGAMSVWVEKYLGKFWGLLSGLTFSVGWVILGGSISIAMGRFTAYWWPLGNIEIATVVWAIFFFTIFAVMNIMGSEIAGNSQLILTVILVGIMIAFGVVGLIKGINMENFTPFMPNGFKGFTAAIPIATFAYMGAACLCTSGAECKNPRDLGKALLWSSITFIAIYTIAMFVVLGTLDWTEASMDVSVFTVAAEVLFGPIGASIVNFAAWLAAATCLIMGTLFTPARIFYEMAKEGYMPKIFAKINEKTKTPVAGLVIIWIVGVIGVLCAYFVGATTFYVNLCNQAVIAWSLSWGLAIISGMKYRNEMGAERIKTEVGWYLPGYPIIPVLALICIAYILYLSLYDVYQFIGLGIWFGIYVVYYLNIKRKIDKGLIRKDVQF